MDHDDDDDENDHSIADCSFSHSWLVQGARGQEVSEQRSIIRLLKGIEVDLWRNASVEAIVATM